MGYMPTDAATRFAMGLPTLPEHMAAAQKAADEDAQIYGSGSSKRQSERLMEGMRGETQRDVATTQGDTQRDVAATQAAAQRAAAQAQADAQRYAADRQAEFRRRSGGMANGGPVNKPDPRASRRGYAKGGPIF